MATSVTTAMCTTFKLDLLKGVHNFTSGQTNFKIALIGTGGTGTYNANTQAAGVPGTGSPTITNLGTDEVSGTGYTAGGLGLTTTAPATDTSTGVAYASFSTTIQWTTATFSANGAMIYNSTATGNNAVSVHSFGGTQSVSAGTFTINLPTNNSTSAILRLT